MPNCLGFSNCSLEANLDNNCSLHYSSSVSLAAVQWTMEMEVKHKAVLSPFHGARQASVGRERITISTQFLCVFLMFLLQDIVLYGLRLVFTKIYLY